MYISYRKLKLYLLFAATFVAVALILNNSSSILKMLYPLKYDNIVFKHSKSNGLDPYLVFAIIKAESSFNTKALSHKNARGLMQLTESTAYEGARKLNLEGFKPDDLYDPETNIKIGSWYLGWLMEQFDGNIDLVITAYNGGIGNVREWLKDRNFSNTGQELDRIPFRETEKFLKKVKSYYCIYKRIYENSK